MSAYEVWNFTLEVFNSAGFWTALSTSVIAIFTVQLARLQKRQFAHEEKVADANYRLSLHDKRLSVVATVETFISDFYRTGEPDLNVASNMAHSLRDADLLFPPDALLPIKEFRDKAGEYFVLKSRREYLRGEADGFFVYDASEGRPSEEEIQKRKVEAHAEISKLVDQMHEITNWVVSQTEGDRSNVKWLTPLRELMTLPPSLKDR